MADKPKAVKSESVFEDAPEIVEDKIIETIADTGLSVVEKAEFSALLKKGLTLEMRADRLIKLTTFTDSKRAPVALRALQEINQITGVTKDAPNESAPMFILPEGLSLGVSVRVQRK